MPQYSNGNGVTYVYSNSPVQYQSVGTPCSAFSTTFAPTQGTSSTPMYVPVSGPHQFTSTNTRIPTLPSQSRTLSHPSYYSANSSSHRGPIHHQRLAPPRDFSHMDGTECQDSANEDTMLSEPMEPPLEGYPDVHEFDELMKRCVSCSFLPGSSNSRSTVTCKNSLQKSKTRP